MLLYNMLDFLPRNERQIVNDLDSISGRVHICAVREAMRNYFDSSVLTGLVFFQRTNNRKNLNKRPQDQLKSRSPNPQSAYCIGYIPRLPQCLSPPPN
jgi:hypothetical protein